MLVKNQQTNQFVNINITEEQFIEVLKQISNKLSQSFSFGIYSKEDIEQEIAIMLLEALPRWDGKRCIYNFLLAHTYYRLSNLKRNKWFRAHCPCKLCDGRENGKTKHSNKKHCKKFIEWKTLNSRKANLASPNSIPEHYDKGIEMNPIHGLTSRELTDYIDIHLSIHLRKSYLKLCGGMRIGQAERLAVEESVQSILNEYYRNKKEK